MKSVDVVIIGASLAGTACLRELTRARIEAVAIERDPFPRDKVCGGFLSPGAVNILAQLNVLDALRTAGAVEIHGAKLRTAGAVTEFSFRRSGLGVSRRTLDAVLANHPAVQQGTVAAAESRADGSFSVQLQSGRQIRAAVVIDAAGKLTLFGKLSTSPQFGIQFYESESRGAVMDFWIFPDGYGGAVSIEGGRSNACFLMNKDALPRYLDKAEKVTGPVAYRSAVSDFISIGDAAGMIDPFCGEGMHHALHTGQLAASSVIQGLGRRWTYIQMRQHYETQRTHFWGRKWAMARAARHALSHPKIVNAALRWNAAWLVDMFWGPQL